MEKLIKAQLGEYMKRHNLFRKYQSGFRRNFACETTVNYLTNRWKFIEKKYWKYFLISKEHLKQLTGKYLFNN